MEPELRPKMESSCVNLKKRVSRIIFMKIIVTDPPFIAQETLRAWQKKNHPWLELSDVHRETTEGVRVTVIPFYMGSRESQNSAVYWVRLLYNFTFFCLLQYHFNSNGIISERIFIKNNVFASLLKS